MCAKTLNFVRFKKKEKKNYNLMLCLRVTTMKMNAMGFAFSTYE